MIVELTFPSNERPRIIAAIGKSGYDVVADTIRSISLDVKGDTFTPKNPSKDYKTQEQMNAEIAMGYARGMMTVLNVPGYKVTIVEGKANEE